MTDEPEQPGAAAPVEVELHRPQRAVAERDARGHFLPGNRTSALGARVRNASSEVHRLRAAVAKACTEQDLLDVMRQLVKDAKAGNQLAVRELLLRRLGKPNDHGTVISIDVGDSLNTAEDVAEAQRRVAAAVARGELPLEAATSFAFVLRAVGESTVAAELGKRLEAIEKHLQREAEKRGDV